jgi:hypothetical protein
MKSLSRLLSAICSSSFATATETASADLQARDAQGVSLVAGIVREVGNDDGGIVGRYPDRLIEAAFRLDRQDGAA